MLFQIQCHNDGSTDLLVGEDCKPLVSDISAKMCGLRDEMVLVQELLHICDLSSHWSDSRTLQHQLASDWLIFKDTA